MTTLVLAVSFLNSHAWKSAALSLVCNYGVLCVLLRVRNRSHQAAS